MLTKYIALISESQQVSYPQVAQIAAALQKQITRDFVPIWGPPATINAFSTLEDVPSDYWVISIRDDIGYDAAGIHLDRNGQPFALVQVNEAVSLTCSHELIEMLVDPFGDRLVASQSIKPDQGRVNYLVEACDPCEGYQFGYDVNGVRVSDFYTSNYFDPVFSPSTRYSFTGTITKPREIAPDGYLSSMIPESGEWWQATFFNGTLAFKSLGALTKEGGKSWRQIIDSITREPVKKLVESHPIDHKNLSEVLLTSSFKNTSNGWANRLREDMLATKKPK